MRFAVLVSGRGTNLQALLDREANGQLSPAEITCVVSNRPDALALERARAGGKQVVVVDHSDHADRDAFDAALLATLREHRIDAIILAGFMRIVGPRLLEAYPNRILNTHPALLPAFPGLAATEQALAHGVKVTGCTVHFVDAGVDTGPIIFQGALPVRDDDVVETLQRRIQTLEHELLPEAARLLAAGRLVCEGRRVRVLPEPAP